MLLFLFVALFATEFLVRGPARFLGSGFIFNDFISPLAQSKAWVGGADPYSPQEVLRLWPKDAAHVDFLSRDAAAGTMAAKDGVPSPYPISCFPLLAPFSRAPWSTIHPAWLATNFVCALLLIGGLASFAELSRNDRRTYIFWGLALGFAPLHTAVAGGNLIVVVGACVVVAMCLAKHNHEIMAGALLGIAACLKPPVGLVFLAYYFFSRRWRTALAGAAVAILVAAAAVLRYGLTVAQWVPSYSANIREMFGAAGINDFSAANYLRFQLLNLQMPVYSVVGDSHAASLITWSITGVLVLWWTVLLMRRTEGQELLDLSTIATIGLLPVYHRFVDAVVLLLPLCFCLKVRVDKHKQIALVIALLLLPFLVPGASLLATLADSGRIPSRVTSGWWWNAAVMPHEAWAVLAVALVLLYAMSLARQGEVKPEPRWSHDLLRLASSPHGGFATSIRASSNSLSSLDISATGVAGPPLHL